MDILRKAIMSFWKCSHPPDGLAAVDVATGRRITYGELCTDVDRVAEMLSERKQKSLVLLLAQNNYECLVAYLAALNAGHTVLLSDATVRSDLLSGLIATYAPDFIISATAEFSIEGFNAHSEYGLRVLRNGALKGTPIHESLSLLLNTSGSTGSPKLVRLSANNLQANAESICSYLNLSANEVAITSLPMAYSYGLSVINSHLAAGATVVLTDDGILRREFWDALDRYGCTSFAGVPYSYQMLLQTGLLSKRGASLRTLTQAGGALGEKHVRQMHQLSVQRGFRFFVMYGQTEATARIAYVPPERLGEKIGSIGTAVPGGSLHIDGETSELIYSGANVMMGYAERREDLARGDECGGILRTGDLARRDADGFFYITGRMKRFLKLFGKRYNLDEVEQIVQLRCGVTAACFGCDDLLMVAVLECGEDATRVRTMLADTFGLPKTAVDVRAVAEIPHTARGKIDYAALLNQSAPALNTHDSGARVAGRHV